MHNAFISTPQHDPKCEYFPLHFSVPLGFLYARQRANGCWFIKMLAGVGTCSDDRFVVGVSEVFFAALYAYL